MGDQETRALLPYGAYGMPWPNIDAKGDAVGFTPEEERILTGGGAFSHSGMYMGPEQAKAVSAAWACIRVISEDIAKMPRALKRVRRDRASGKMRSEVIDDHPVARVLEQPNEWMTGMEFFAWLVGVATCHEGAYALITRSDDGRVQELLPLMPGAVSCEHIAGSRWELIYRVSGYGETFIAREGELLKLRGPLRDDYVRGHAVAHLAREAMGLSARMERSQARFHGNDMRPSGILSSKALGLSPEAREEIRAQWEAQHGPGGEGGIAVMDGDWSFSAAIQNSVDSQVIENRRFQIEEICRFFRVFPQIIGHSQGSVGYNGHEQLLNAHGEHTLLPWVVRVEQACNRDLLTGLDRQHGLTVDIDQDAVKRGTLTDRISGYDKAVKIYKTPNEIRAEEGLDPIDEPAMDRVQLQMNNTGLAPRGDTSVDKEPGQRPPTSGEPALAPGRVAPLPASPAKSARRRRWKIF